jgi:hypothetical protein
MGRKKKPKWDDPDQSARFIEFAEQNQVEDAEERFEEAMRRIVSAKKPKAETHTKAEK